MRFAHRVCPGFLSGRLGWLVVFGVAQLFPAGAGAAEAEDIFANRFVPRIRIEIPEEGMEVLRQYNWRRTEESEPRVDVRVTVREDGTVYTNVALHLKGSAGSFQPIDSDKPALTLHFSKFAEGQRFHGLQKLHLNNSVQDPSYVSEQISRELFLKAGLPSPRAGHAIVQVNGSPPQLYVLVEGWNKQFFRRYFKNPDGNVYDGGAAKDVTHPLVAASGDRVGDRAKLEALVEAAQETNAAVRLARLDKVLDLDRFITFVAMEVLTAHWDGYALNRNNYRVFHDLEADRLVFLPHGMDQMFGVWRMNPTSSITPMMKGLVARAVISAPEGRRRYLERMAHLSTNVLDAAAITNRVEEISAKIRPLLAGGLIGLAGQFQSASAFGQRVTARLASVRNQLQTVNQPLAFDAANAAKLGQWRSSRDSGSPSFTRSRGDRPTLQISANGNLGYGSWRTQVLLDTGEYQFTGRFRTDNLQFNRSVTNAGVTLRLSGERKPRMITSAPEWTDFTYDFTVNDLMDVELVCEFRASNGRVWFDEDSLRLVRKSVARAR